MCNQIFGRDTLPKSRISGNTMEFDISMSKLIVFVQGENIADLKITGGTYSGLVKNYGTMSGVKFTGSFFYDPSSDGTIISVIVICIYEDLDIH